MHHFEVKMSEDPTELGVVPPMIALTTVSPYDPPRESNFHLDLLRFWPRNDGESFTTINGSFWFNLFLITQCFLWQNSFNSIKYQILKLYQWFYLFLA